MEFARSKKGIFVSQWKCVLDLLEKTGLLGCKAAKTPIEPILKLQYAKPKDVKNREQFQRLVGRLIYLSHTHLDIAFFSEHGVKYDEELEGKRIIFFLDFSLYIPIYLYKYS